MVSAHGGVEKSAGNILVTLFQSPLSPLMGENVTFSFILTDPAKKHVLKSKKVHVVITKTFTGDASRDQVVFSKDVRSDVNGTITFTYSFPTTNYYDIDLAFGRPNDEESTTGFLVQPRANLQNNIEFLEIIVVVSILINFLLLLYWLRNKLRAIRT
ncbi:MAG TPA: hypothetical protein VLF89_08715 [Candidatus Saccharimonadales bacterium]|nr:hypothetical protein [Candidatus Saccharimonadales bacterium]